MKRQLSTAALLVAATALAAAFAGSAAAATSGRGGDPAEVAKRLKQEARGTVTIAAQKSTGHAAFVRASRSGDLFPASKATTPSGKALGFFKEYGGLVGASDSELVQVGSRTDALGATHLTYQQVHGGVPVFGGIVRAHLDAQNELISVNGAAVPDLALGTTPTLSEADAARRAVAAVLADPIVGRDDSSLRLGADALLGTPSVTLYAYNEGLISGTASSSQLVYQVEVTNARDVREYVFVHAHSGKVVNRYSGSHDALHRVLYESSPATPPIWQEGDPFPGALNADQQNIVAFGGDSYRYFANSFGRDSYDGAGASLRSVNNDPRINCPNANWNGSTTNYCNGVTADDVVAHEWGHAYTEYTHGLIYQWQSGALNESYSDIWGEVVDQLNAAGTDSPAPVRSDACSSFTRALPGFTINAPSTIAGECPAGGALFGPPLGAPITSDIVPANDGTVNPTFACTPILNGAEIAGKIALVDRGACAFTIKVKNAQNAGAIGVVVGNSVEGIITMSGVDPTITIPALSIPLSYSTAIKNAITGGAAVNVTMRDKGGAREASYRWLMGEDATAFGGAIRDLWKPNCLGHPGRVSDPMYHCASTDSGGVHINSGVPNHGFAMLVDGATYNGHTVAPIGMVKAAHLYWRAQTVYQTPTSGFPDHADALEASCADLIGVPLEGLSTTSTPAGPSGQAITAADCAAVSAMIAAVELRGDPTQCNFQPLLKGDPPALCEGPTATVYHETFEAGLGGWTLTNSGVFAGWPGLNWETDSSLPDGRAGSAAYGPTPDLGDCGAGANDISGVARLESQPIKIPNGKALGQAKFSFDHYVATEAGWDGGNVKVSVNGGEYMQVPASAFLYNPYNATMQSAAAGNTNPLAGQPGFTGTDGGQLGGSWGQSQIDLTTLGVQAGDTIRVRFDIGMDGCTGIDGWYVDDVKVTLCNLKAIKS